MDEALIQMNVKLPQSLYDRLEAYRQAQPFVPSRAAVVRAMIERALDSEAAERRVAPKELRRL
jgi:Arc/MetJ-type ribon-helix-helix transcriptional regulator